MTARRPKTEHDPISPVDPAIARAITRANGSFAVWDKSELANLIHVAGCAAFRLFAETKDAQALEAQDILVALAGAIRRNDAGLLKSLHDPALSALADREVTLEGEGKSSGLEPHLRAHGGKQRFGEYLIELAEAGAAIYGNDEAKFARFVSLRVVRGQFEGLDVETVRKKLLKSFKGGPDKDPEEVAAKFAMACGMKAKTARNMVSTAWVARERRREKQLAERKARAG
jgi:hypothetical protein